MFVMSVESMDEDGIEDGIEVTGVCLLGQVSGSHKFTQW